MDQITIRFLNLSPRSRLILLFAEPHVSFAVENVGADLSGWTRVGVGGGVDSCGR